MSRVWIAGLICAGLIVASYGWTAPEPPRETGLRFEVTMAKGLLKDATDGRLFVVLGQRGQPEPRRAIGQTGMTMPPVLGADVKAFAPGVVGVIDQKCVMFPIEHLSQLPAGDYSVQAVFHHNRDLNLVDAPGNLYSEAKAFSLDPSKAATIKLELTKAIPAESMPADTAAVKYIKLKSELLSKFFGRDMYVRAALVLPTGFDTDTDRRYPLRVHIGGYGTRYTAGGRMRSRATRIRRACCCSISTELAPLAIRIRSIRPTMVLWAMPSRRS